MDVTSVSTAADRRTVLALVARRADGSPDFLFYGDRPAHLALRLDRADRRTIRRARVFHFGSLSLAGEPARRATLAALAEAERAGRFRSFDPNLRLGLWPDAGTARRWLRAGLRHADCVKVNADELRFLTGEADVGRGLARLTASGPALAVATLGARGCAYHGPGGAGRVRGFPARVVDTTGAGDAFVAGLLVGLLDAGGDPAETLGDRIQLEAALAFANAAAALCTERMGGIPSLPSRRRVRARLRPRLTGVSREVARQAPDGSS